MKIAGKHKRYFAGRKAFIVPFIVIVIMLFLAVLTVIVDGGRMIVSHSELNGVAEVAALTAATVESPTDASLKAGLAKFAELNKMSNCTWTSSIIEINNDSEQKGYRISVTIKRVIPLLLSSRVGFRKFTVVAKASVISRKGEVRLVQ